jgi:hypothetical protein
LRKNGADAVRINWQVRSAVADRLATSLSNGNFAERGHCRASGKCQWPRKQNVSGASCGHSTTERGRRARYEGPRKNLSDLCRCAVVHNLYVIARAPWAIEQAA